jgi:hypothetical protein
MPERYAFALGAFGLCALNSAFVDHVGRPPEVGLLLYMCFALCAVFGNFGALLLLDAAARWFGGWARNKWLEVD